MHPGSSWPGSGSKSKEKNQIPIKENNQILTKVQKPGSYQGKKPDPNGVKKLDLKQSLKTRILSK